MAAKKVLIASILLSFVFGAGLLGCDSKAQSSIEDRSRSEEPETKNSKWGFREQKDPITDKISRFATLESNESPDLYLVIHCSGGSGIDSVALQSGEYSTYEVATMIYRIDDSKPIEEPWSVSKTFYNRLHDGQEYIDQFYKRLEGAKKLTMRTDPIDPSDRSVTLTFDIRDIEKARQYVQEVGACAKRPS